MRNLVIGSGGFTGKPFCKFLRDKGEEVVEMDVKNGENEDARFVDLCLNDIDMVYFLAWDVGGAKYLYKEDVQLSQLDWNLKLMTNVFNQLQVSKKPFLFISTQLVEELDTVYAATKRLGEIWTKLLGGAYVREWNVYGAFEAYDEKSHVISDFIHQALTKGKIEMMTTGEEMRQFIHIDDVCSGWYEVGSKQLKGIFDISTFEWVSILEVAKIIGSLTGAEVVPGTKKGNSHYFIPLKGKIPDWSAKVRLEDGLKGMIEDYRKVIK